MMKLTRLRVEGFKALDGFEAEIPKDILFLIGDNGAGKSSVLQALAFARAFAKISNGAFFEDRHWQARDLYPKTRRPEDADRPDAQLRGVRRRSSARPVRMSFRLEEGKTKVFWEFSWSSTTEITLNEQLWVSDSSGIRQIWSLEGSRLSRNADAGHFNIADLRINGSYTALFRESFFEDEKDMEAFLAFRAWCEGITSLELLSPVAMRRGARGTPKDIGPRGELLAGFLASLPAEKRSSIVQRLSAFYPLEGLDTTRKRAGWVDMQVAEAYKGIGTVRPQHMSDGFFRLLALCSIPEFGPAVSMVLLDEVEDGIEPHILPKIIKRIARETSAQLIMTSHSPLLINFFEPQQIAFLARDEEGRTQVATPNELEEFRRGSEYFGNGEIWVNSSARKLAAAVLKVSRRRSAASGAASGPRALSFLAAP